MSNATGKTLIENERVKATLWSFAPGQDTGWHRHEYDYVIVPLTDGKLRIELPGGGEAISELKIGIPYFRNVGVEHNVINANDHPFQFLEIELLER
jgi:quercetin dioxygenase-like cupin family protein